MDRAARVMRVWGATALLASFPACSTELPPLGEAVVVVDTDLPVPELAGALRLDLYSADSSAGVGRWYESRTIALPDPRDWPVSFSIYAPEDGGRIGLLRLRVYPRGRERDYRGERFLPPPPVGLASDLAHEPPDPTQGEEPRLVIGGVDVTPSTEPQPGVTVDRLFRLRLTEGEVGDVHVALAGDCVGTMADIEGLRSCIDTEKLLEPVVELGLEPRSGLPETSAQGSFAPLAACARQTRAPSGAPFHDEEVCVPGGAFIFGNAEAFGIAEASGVPERVASLPPFFIDRYEVTVARVRRAFDEGFVSDDLTPQVNDGPLDRQAPAGTSTLCTYTSGPGAREDFPATCVSQVTARAFCQFYGGDLPSEAQWEYVAQVAGRDGETPYPWGSSSPRCDQAAFGLVSAGVAALLGGNQCLGDGIEPGPRPVTAFATPGGDLSLGLEVAGLGGSVQELMRDDFLPLNSVCWAAAPLRSPVCDVDDPKAKSMRGGNWAASALLVYPGLRSSFLIQDGMDTIFTTVGFRCVWPDDS